MIYLLKFERGRTKKQLADIFGKDVKTITRDLKTLDKFFALDYDDKNRPYIFLEEDEEGLYLHITDEEIKYLDSILEKNPDKIARGIHRKIKNDLFTQLDRPAFLSSHIQAVKRAIKFEKQIKLSYQSGKNLFATERLLEPVKVLDTKFMVAFDTKSESNKIYAFERIDGQIEITSNDMQHKVHHKNLSADIFGMYTGKVYRVQLLLKPRAYLLLREEYPRSILHTNRSEDQTYPWKYDDQVFGLEGIGRFVLGLLDEVKIIDSPNLTSYVKNKVAQYLT